MPARRRRVQETDPAWSGAITAMDARIRSGQGAAVRSELVHLLKEAPPREVHADLAWLCWRVGSPESGVKLLNPTVRPKARTPVSASDREKAEYASCLTRIGAVDEALAILSSVSKKVFPRAALYEVFALVAEWRYSETIALLQRYLSTKPSSYDELVANVNLAAALVVSRRDEEAVALLERLEAQAENENHLLLLGNVRELQAASHVRMRRWTDARRACERAAIGLKDHGGIFALILDKWAAVCEAGAADGKQQPAKWLEPIKARARALEHWETIRDCERFEFSLTGSPALFSKLYFGTPFPEFRESLKLEMTVPFSIPKSYEWSVADDGGPVVDLTTAVAGVKVGQQNHRVLAALSSDFYRPFRTAQLHARLFPGEFYNPVSAPHRVAEAIHRTKSWLEQSALPLSIAHTDAGYRLTSETGARVRVALEVDTDEARDWKSLQAAFGENGFSISEAVARLGHPRRTTARLLHEWTETGMLSKTGAGRSTRYRIKTESGE